MNGKCASRTSPLPADQYTFPQALKESGYYAVLAGKNHIEPAVQQAFDVVVGGKGSGTRKVAR